MSQISAETWVIAAAILIGAMFIREGIVTGLKYLSKTMAK